MFVALMQRFIIGPPQDMQQPLFNVGTFNTIDPQPFFSQPVPVYGRNSATF